MNKAESSRAFLVVALLPVALACSCASDTIVHGVNEKEANQIIEVLADREISAQKLMNVAGREVVYDLAVPGSDRLQAIRILNKNELPRRRDRGYQETFSESGLIPTAAEERSKRMAALEGEIERQIKLIDGVLDVQVQLVMPEESALRTTREQEPMTTASVTIKYLAGPGDTMPIPAQEVTKILAAGVEKLAPENVVVYMQAAGAAPGARAEASGGGSPFGLNQKQFKIALAGLLILFVLMGLGLAFMRISLGRVRSRLIRLQNEIAKARGKKSGDALPSSSSSPGGAGATSS